MWHVAVVKSVLNMNSHHTRSTSLFNLLFLIVPRFPFYPIFLGKLCPEFVVHILETLFFVISWYSLALFKTNSAPSQWYSHGPVTFHPFFKYYAVYKTTIWKAFQQFPFSQFTTILKSLNFSFWRHPNSQLQLALISTLTGFNCFLPLY